MMSNTYLRFLELRRLFELGRVRVPSSFEQVFGQRPPAEYTKGVTIEGEYEVVTDKKALPEPEGK